MSDKVIILINLGSPKSLHIKDIKSYLNEFLMDERVIDLPYFLRFILVKFIIIPIRAYKTQKKYMKIWKNGESPLIAGSKKLAEKLQTKLNMPVYLTMRYAAENQQDLIKKIVNENSNLREICIFPMYPHYAMSSYETALLYLKNMIENETKNIKITQIDAFYNHPFYIDALVNLYKDIPWHEYDRIIFSYHGIPFRHLKKTDTNNHCLQTKDCCKVKSQAHEYCYKHQTETTTQLVSTKLALESKFVIEAYQSRFSSDKWLTPNTSELILKLSNDGIKRICVICPSFLIDCLETLEEIQLELKTLFLKNNGIEFHYLPCLNSNDYWVESLTKIIQEQQ
jgi:ferrochelatase